MPNVSRIPQLPGATSFSSQMGNCPEFGKACFPGLELMCSALILQNIYCILCNTYYSMHLVGSFNGHCTQRGDPGYCMMKSVYQFTDAFGEIEA